MMHNLINASTVTNEESTLSNETYLIELEVVGGCSQYAQVTKEQAMALGVQFPAEERPVELMETETPTVVNTSIVNQNKKAESNLYHYKVVQPEDLNLRHKSGLARGRPKKPKPNKEDTTLRKVVKTARTRSGRITRPPIHMEKNFEKIVTDEDKHEAPSNNKDVSTIEFAALKTNDDPVTVPGLVEIAEKRKKPFSRYRCPTCRKVYLGRNLLEAHLKKNPGHGSSQLNELNLVDCETWSFLIDTALKTKDGCKGEKFCNELLNLIKNARVLVKYFFKPGYPDYYINSILSSVLEIEEGCYRFNENVICKDVSIFSFLEYIDNFGDKNTTKSEIDDVLDVLKPHVEEDKTNQEENVNDMQIMEKSNFENLFNCDNFPNLPNDFVTTENIIGFEFDSKINKSNENYFEPKQTIVGTTESKTININEEKAEEEEKLDNKKVDDFDLRKLHLLGEDGLILPDNNILDTSTNSDDIMNVDQFVNERFKKLTESDDLQNTALSLDLPSLECFEFHTD